VRSFEFRLIPARQLSETDINSLYENGFDDSLIVQESDGVDAIVVNRRARSLIDALVRALKDCEKAGVAVSGVADEDLVTLREIAERSDQTYEAVRRLARGLRGPGGFPQPVVQGVCAYYSWSSVAEWLEGHYEGAFRDFGETEALHVANLILRARHLAPRPSDWAPLLR
jgi:hypothetical protein